MTPDPRDALLLAVAEAVADIVGSYSMLPDARVHGIEVLVSALRREIEKEEIENGR